MTHLRVAVLVDLPRDAASGGHVKYWERIGHAASKEATDIDLTIYFSGTGEDEVLSPHVRFKFLAPVFSTARLKFLSYVPSHTDLASFHPKLAQELTSYDVIHTTDGFFSFARTAERVARWNRIPLMTSFHTDILSYSEIFTTVTLENLVGERFTKVLTRFLNIPRHARISKEKRLRKHLASCASVMAMRAEDIEFARRVLPFEKVHSMHLGVDKDLFQFQRQDRNGIEREYGIEPGKFIVLFVGRVDVGKNMQVLLKACKNAIDSRTPLHLIVAGIGPLSDEVKATLGTNATLTGLIEPAKLARIYASVDCLAIASDVEIGGMIGLEALSAGCPVLVSNQSGVAQLCDNTPAMLKVQSGVEPWTKALIDIAKDPAKISTMRDAAFVYRRDRLLSWSEVLTQDFVPAWQEVSRRKP